jgi:hypothetical protein
MAIKTLEQRKKQRMLIFVGLGIAVLAFLIFYFGINKEPGAPAEESIASNVPATGAILESRLEKIDLNTEFLIKTILPFLKVHGNLPIEKGTTGRPNPFSP